MASAREIRSRLSEWLVGTTTLREFEDWFVPATWNMHRSGDKAAEDLVEDIEIILSEYSDGYLSRDEVRERLSTLAYGSLFSHLIISPKQESPSVKTYSSAQLTRLSLRRA
jgi:hypothetical protein